MLRLTDQTLPSLDLLALSSEELYIFGEGQVLGEFLAEQRAQKAINTLYQRIDALETELRRSNNA